MGSEKQTNKQTKGVEGNPGKLCSKQVSFSATCHIQLCFMKLTHTNGNFEVTHQLSKIEYRCKSSH